jgi:hypothetical protein
LGGAYRSGFPVPAAQRVSFGLGICFTYLFGTVSLCVQAAVSWVLALEANVGMQMLFGGRRSRARSCARSQIWGSACARRTRVERYHLCWAKIGVELEAWASQCQQHEECRLCGRLFFARSSRRFVLVHKRRFTLYFR